MEKLTLDQFKTDAKGKGSRLSLDQFKSNMPSQVNNEELEKLTGGILGACHVEPKSWFDRLVDAVFNSNPNNAGEILGGALRK